MNKNPVVFKKTLVIGIIILFIGMSINPSTGTLVEKTSSMTIGSPGYIQDLIDNASDGDTIYIPSGIYYENIVIDKSISLLGTSKNTTVIDGNGSGDVIYICSDWVNISGFTIQNSGDGWDDAGIKIYSDYNTISGNIISNNRIYGIYIYESSGNTITDNNISNNDRNGISLWYSSGNIITDNTISKNDDGIKLYDSSDNNTITNNNILSNNMFGIKLYKTSGNIITGNTMVDDGISISSSILEHWNTHVIDTSNTVNGKPVIYWKNQIDGTIPACAGQVILANCTNVVVENQNISSGDIGIILGFSSGCTIRDSNISNNDRSGICLYGFSGNNIITGNNIISNNRDGIELLGGSGNNTITNNIISNNNFGIYLLSSSSGNNTIRDNNIISNNECGISIYEYSGNNTIRDNNITNNGYGIRLSRSGGNNITGNTISNSFSDFHLHFSSGNIITYNTFENNWFGIRLSGSSSNTITSNVIISSYKEGIRLYRFSCNNTITDNNITNSSVGIQLYNFSSSNTITDNNIISNKYDGILILDSSSNNNIYHNNFIDNSNNAYDECNNTWDNGYPSGGNYWDDYTGNDTDGDGIGDIPYPIPGGNNVDRYPLMAPLGNQPPDAPMIDGPKKGKPGIDYDYTFVATDPDGDDIWYHIGWGDKEIIYIYGPYPSGWEITLSYNWSEKGVFTISAMTKDIYDSESDWSEFEVTIPRSRMSINSLFLWFLERFPLLEKLLTLIRAC